MKKLQNLWKWVVNQALRFIHSDFKSPLGLFKIWAALFTIAVLLLLCGIGKNKPVAQMPNDVRSSAGVMQPHTFETLLQKWPDRIQQVVIYPGVSDVLVYIVPAQGAQQASPAASQTAPATGTTTDTGAAAPTPADKTASPPQDKTNGPNQPTPTPQAKTKAPKGQGPDHPSGHNYKLPNGIVVFLRDAINAAPISGLPQVSPIPLPGTLPAPASVKPKENKPDADLNAAAGQQDHATVVPSFGDDITKIDPSYIVNFPDHAKLLHDLDGAHVHHDSGTPYLANGFFTTIAGWYWVVVVVLGGFIVFIGIFTKSRSSDAPGSLSIAAGAGGGTGEPSDDSPEGDDVKVTFDMVGGCDEAVEKLRTISEWLKYRYYYDYFQAELPKGVLLEGPSGTGKTYLARALKTEAGNADLWICAASEFIEMYVGVGASRIRSKFEKAEKRFKKTGRLQIIFIDELDAVGSHRTNGSAGGDKEHNQTINQLLTCIDGFSSCKGIFVIGATNLKQNLDPALLRPGRLSYHIQVYPPDQAGREKIFTIHTRGMVLAADVSYKEMARRTPGMTGATIKHICNDAAIRAAKRARVKAEAEGLTEEQVKELIAQNKFSRDVYRIDFDAAIDEAQFGDHLESKQKNQAVDDQILTSYHEAAHGVALAIKSKGKDLPTKVSRQMRSESLGMMQSHTETDRYTYRQDYLETRIVCAFAGRLGQTILVGKDQVDTGAGNDFEQASRMCRLMCGSWGMSPELGEISIPLDAQTGFPTVVLGAQLQNDFDNAWRKMVKRLNDEAIEIVKQNMDAVERIASVVFEDETVFTDRFKKLLEAEEKPDLAPEIVAVKEKREAAAKLDAGEELL